MSYCTSDDVTGRNHALLDSASAGDVTKAISKAQGIVDGMLRSRYYVPLTTVPDEILGITADLAASFLLSSEVGNNATNEDPVQADGLYKKAMDLLKLINEGSMVLDVETPEGTDETSVLKQARCNTYRDHHGKFDYWNPSDPRTYRDHRHRRR